MISRHMLPVILSLLVASSAFPAVSLPSIFGNNMVFQREKPVRVFGFAAPGESVSVTIGKETVSVTAADDGSFTAVLKPRPAGGPFTVTVKGSNTITLTNVLFGEVWIGSGQSNMEWPVIRTIDFSNEISNANFPALRLFTVKKKVLMSPTNDADVIGWASCSPSNVGGFSATLFYFGRELHERLKVPVGLVHTSWGGTPAESWTSMEGFDDDPELAIFRTRFVQMTNALTKKDNKQEMIVYQKKLAAWEDSQRLKDPGNKGFGRGYARADLDDASWQTMMLPQAWENAGLAIDGALWFRKTIDIPASWNNKDLVLAIGAVDDFDVTYFNNFEVGATGTNVTNWWAYPRRYSVPATQVKQGKAIIAVRAFDNYGGGGLVGPAGEMKIFPKDAPKDAIALTGTWRYFIEMQAKPREPRGQRPVGPADISRPQNIPSSLFNAMIAPLTNFVIRGAVWYQGESNAGRAYQYRKLFAAMIKDWRKRWGIGDFPFYFVQLANYMAKTPAPGECAWAELREAQTMTLSLPATAMAVIIDVGEASNIHPWNKQAVGRRLAYPALKNIYGMRVSSSGPLYRSMSVEGSAIRINFDYVSGGLSVYGTNDLYGFSIAGDDKKFHWATAVIESNTVVVKSPRVPNPVAVRYGWANNPDVSLYNTAYLPASPFRTDSWPGLTINNK
ncbi:MAG: sialate O-acetylesterase [Spirochaetota bacterium]